jgi:hypothetical protein
MGLRPQGKAIAGRERLASPMQPASDTLALLQASLAEAGRLAGLQLPSPVLTWQERNWLLGVRQHLVVELDLRGADPVPGAEASLQLQPLHPRAVTMATPAAVEPLQQAGRTVLRWPLQPGALNRLELRCWRWSPLGLGSAAIGGALVMVLCLANLRQRLGFGWPQLPA